jgi:hypothetical protein
MDWIEIGFVNQIEIVWKMFKNIKFSETFFFSRKLIGLWFVLCINDYKMILKGMSEL